MNKKTQARPLSLEDIRYFESEGLVDDDAPHRYADKLFLVPRRATALANRLATLCYLERVSITKRALYLCFTPALAEGVVLPTNYQRAVWQRYVMYGLPLDYNELDEESRTELVWQATLDALQAIVPPEQFPAVEKAAKEVEAAGEDFQSLTTSTKNKDYLVDVGYTMPTWPTEARLLLTVTDRSTLEKATCTLFKSKLSWVCGFLGSKVRIVDDQAVVTPSSASRSFYARDNNVSSFVVDIKSVLKGKASVIRNPHPEHDPDRFSAAEEFFRFHS